MNRWHSKSRRLKYTEILAHFFFASPAFVCKNSPTKKRFSKVTHQHKLRSRSCLRRRDFYQKLFDFFHRNAMKSPHSKCTLILGHSSLMSANVHTFFTPRIFFALFFLSFICLRDFSTLVARPFCRNPNRQSKKNADRQCCFNHRICIAM